MWWAEPKSKLKINVDIKRGTADAPSRKSIGDIVIENQNDQIDVDEESRFARNIRDN